MNTKMHNLARDFETLQLDSQSFDHCRHVQVAWEFLNAHSFLDATARYAKTIVAMAERDGVPQKFNTTITVALMALIAERIEDAPQLGFEAFAAGNTDLFEKNVLARWYSHERLHSPTARAVFVLPDKTT